ncbi:MAG: segregation/condensation protein A [Elusimicrobia bacterium]|nr:segregation/condensation protein A [Elusimicrobiota bacterium]
MVYDVHLESFEGPLDLLLHLIRKNDLEIHEIQIAEITKEYLEYINLMQNFNIDIAGEFLVMASTLMQIKARTLLPTPEGAAQEEDPLDNLKARLLEYQKYKEIGKLLSYKELEYSQVYYRPAYVTSKEDFVLEASIFDLVGLFKEALQALPETVKEILYKEIPIETKIREILDVLEGKQYVSFSEILKIQKNRQQLIVAFMAILELVKSRQVSARQTELFGDIRIYKIYAPDPEVKDNNENFGFVEEMEIAQTPAEPAPPNLELTNQTQDDTNEDLNAQGETNGNI